MKVKYKFNSGMGAILCNECNRIIQDCISPEDAYKSKIYYCKQCLRSKEDSEFIDRFVTRLKNIGIEVELSANYPWIYLDKINKKKVTEHFHSEHGFTVAWFPVNIDRKACFSDITEIIKLLRKYTE